MMGSQHNAGQKVKQKDYRLGTVAISVFVNGKRGDFFGYTDAEKILPEIDNAPCV